MFLCAGIVGEPKTNSTTLSTSRCSSKHYTHVRLKSRCILSFPFLTHGDWLYNVRSALSASMVS